MRGVGISTNLSHTLSPAAMGFVDISVGYFKKDGWVAIPYFHVHIWADDVHMKATAFRCRCRGHEKKVGPNCPVLLWRGIGAPAVTHELGIIENKTRRNDVSFSRSLEEFAACALCGTYYNHRKHEPFAIYYQRLKEKEGEKPGWVGFRFFGGWLRDRSHPARR
jgi:hypothetical protein